MNPLLKEKIKECVQLAAPNECCGLLFGFIKEFGKNGDYSYHYIGERVRCIPSDKKSPVSFFIENLENLNEIILEELRIGGNRMQIINIFHSHPSGNYPSALDIDTMKYLDKFGEDSTSFMSKAFKNLIWLIIDSKSNEIKGFIYYQNKIHQVDVILNE